MIFYKDKKDIIPTLKKNDFFMRTIEGFVKEYGVGEDYEEELKFILVDDVDFIDQLYKYSDDCLDIFTGAIEPREVRWRNISFLSGIGTLYCDIGFKCSNLGNNYVIDFHVMRLSDNKGFENKYIKGIYDIEDDVDHKEFGWLVFRNDYINDYYMKPGSKRFRYGKKMKRQEIIMCSGLREKDFETRVDFLVELF
jgi:hypothetical protein